jgi:hypothetical protein
MMLWSDAADKRYRNHPFVWGRCTPHLQDIYCCGPSVSGGEGVSVKDCIDLGVIRQIAEAA